MTREEELITRWIDGELNGQDEADFKKLYDSNPDIFYSFKEDSGIYKQVFRDHYESEKEVPYGDFFNSQIKKKILEENGSTSTPSSFLSDMIQWIKSPFTWSAAALSFCLIVFFNIPSESGFSGGTIVSTYSPDASVSIVSAEFNEEANATVIVLEGLEPVPNETDFSGNHIVSYDRQGPPGFVQFYNKNDKLVYILETDEYGQPNVF